MSLPHGCLNLLLLITIISLSGCGSAPVGKVSGKVTYKDAPVSEGSIIFQNADGTVAMSSNLNADGTYTITSADRNGLPPGEYKVAISPSKIGSGDMVMAVDPNSVAAAPPPQVPAKYHSIDSSGLTATVKAGDNPPYNFALVD